MNIIFEEGNLKEALYPFTATREVADIRIGILTIREKWNLLLGMLGVNEIEGTIHVPSAVMPTEAYVKNKLSDTDAALLAQSIPVSSINKPWDIFLLNDGALRNDFELITAGRNSQPVSSTNRVIGPPDIFLEEGATLEHCMINCTAGPVYIGKNATIMEGCLLRGPLAVCEGALLKMGTKVYGATTIGPYCIGGGEIKNSVLFEYSNKAHDGYLGDSVIGSWCNLGAGTSNSNVKNTAGPVKLWDNQSRDYVPVGQKAGLLMGDYSRAAINTSFNTGTVVGVCCNIYGEGFPPKFISDFTWGKERYTFEKALVDIDNWKKLKGHALTDKEILQLKTLYNQ